MHRAHSRPPLFTVFTGIMLEEVRRLSLMMAPDNKSEDHRSHEVWVYSQFQPFIPFQIPPVFGHFVSCGIRIHMFDLPFQKDVFVFKRREKAGATLGHHTGQMTFAQSSFSLSCRFISLCRTPTVSGAG